LKTRVKETQDQTNKAKVDTERLTKLNGKIGMISYLISKADRNQENMSIVTKLSGKVKTRFDENKLMNDIVDKLK
jgi:hypothetical protein